MSYVQSDTWCYQMMFKETRAWTDYNSNISSKH